jgi:glycine cleavage system aminomethyltransferase T
MGTSKPKGATSRPEDLSRSARDRRPSATPPPCAATSKAGQPWDIGPGAPATPERVESGLVSVGGDTDDDTNPFEVRLGKYVDLDVPDDVVGIQALRRIKAEGVKRHQLGVVLEGDKPAPMGFRLEEISHHGKVVGKMTNCVWSPRMKANIGFGLLSAAVLAGETVMVKRANGEVAARLVELPFL